MAIQGNVCDIYVRVPKKWLRRIIRRITGNQEVVVKTTIFGHAKWIWNGYIPTILVTIRLG